jgi:hypothetical protein
MHTGCGAYIVQLERATTTDGAVETPTTVYAKTNAGVCETEPNLIYEPNWLLVQLYNLGQAVDAGTGISGVAFTAFTHTNDKVYLRANGCVLYQYSGNTAQNPVTSVSAVWPVLGANGVFHNTVPCAPSPETPPSPPAMPPPTVPALCDNTCVGIIDTASKKQWVTGGACDSPNNNCVANSIDPNAGPVYSFSGNGICEDGGSNSVSDNFYFLCALYTLNSTHVHAIPH